jgi:methylmalonyl-CoA/ethylmalonyl-CoA epimerase
MKAVKKVDHLGIAVKDLQEALAFYEKTLGITCTHVEEMPERGIKVAFLPLGAGRIELIAPTRDNSEVSRFLETRGSGIHHICFEAPDAQAAVDGLKAAGVRMVDETLKPGAHHTQVAFVHPKSTCGVLIELAQHPKDHHA